MLKKILIGLAVLVALFVVIVAMQPSDFRVEKSATIAAPPTEVFAQVNDLHKWDAWSPWAKLDPEAKIAFEGPESGQGAAMSWSGNDRVGEGKMTIVESCTMRRSSSRSISSSRSRGPATRSSASSRRPTRPESPGP